MDLSSGIMWFPILTMILGFLFTVIGITGIIFAIVYFRRISISLQNIQRTLASQTPPKEDN